MKQVRKRLTYANVVSSICLFFVLTGATAIAATNLKIGPKQIKANAVRTGKIAKEAVTAGKLKQGAVIESRIADGAVTAAKIADGAITGEKVKLSSLGAVPTAQNAEKLGGKDPGAFESKGVSVAPGFFVPIGANKTTTVASLNLPAGTYMVVGSGVINSNSPAPVTGVTCEVAAGGKAQQNEFGKLAEKNEIGDRDAFALPLITTLAAPGEATLSCTTPAGWEGNVVTPSLAAVSLQG